MSRAPGSGWAKRERSSWEAGDSPEKGGEQGAQAPRKEARQAEAH